MFRYVLPTLLLTYPAWGSPQRTTGCAIEKEAAPTPIKQTSSMATSLMTTSDVFFVPIFFEKGSLEDVEAIRACPWWLWNGWTVCRAPAHSALVLCEPQRLSEFDPTKFVIVKQSNAQTRSVFKCVSPYLSSCSLLSSLFPMFPGTW